MRVESTTNPDRQTYRFRSGKKLPKCLESINENAAGIDIGAAEHYVSVPEDRDDNPVRIYGCYTPDLMAMAQWLVACGIDTVAIESTGVYWIPVYRVLESHGLDVHLVNARHVKHVPGRKTDVLDCQWLRTLHTFGLLTASFVPSHSIDALRTYWRHRKELVRSASREVLHMQKSMIQMNLHLHVVLSDITGVTGMKILRAIVAGQRQPEYLASFRHPSVKRSEEEIAKALTGDYRDEHLFTLKQALELYDIYQEKIADCDRELAQRMQHFESKATPSQLKESAEKKKQKKRRKNEPHFDLRSECQRITGVDLTQIPGIDAMTAFTVITECEIHAFPTMKRFTSWLALAPNNTITGGNVKKSSTKKVNNRIADALRVAAQSLHRSKTYLGAFYRRKRRYLEPAKAITATAHKLARLIYTMLTKGQEYIERGQEYEEEQHQKQKLKHIIKQVTAMGLELLDPQTGEIITYISQLQEAIQPTVENKGLT